MNKFVLTAIKTGGSAARQNAIPGLTLLVVALALLGSYYGVPLVQEQVDAFGSRLMSWGSWSAVMMTMTFGGIIPLSIEAIQARSKGQAQRPLGQIVFTLLVWAVNGYLVHKFYLVQAYLFGNEITLSSVIKKVLVDQLVWVPVYVVPTFTLFFLWRDCAFSASQVRDALSRKSYLERTIPLMISNWSVWTPAVCVIYAFPLALQVILMNLILVFWSLILSFFVKK